MFDKALYKYGRSKKILTINISLVLQVLLLVSLVSRVSQPATHSGGLVYFRNRIGTAGMELTLKESVRLNGKEGKEKDVCVDTTV